MRRNTINGLLRDAMNALELGRAALAFRLVSTAETIAEHDSGISAERLGAIRSARLAVAIAI